MNWERFTLFLFIGFFAQLIDGTLGMAYGLSCRTFLKTIAGLPAALASAAVHCAEMFTTLVSGLSHLSLKNVSLDLLWRLMLPGVAGGVLGAWFLTRVGDVLEPFIDVYLIVMGFVILCRASRKERERPRRISPYVFPLGFVGGFLDATGGGGWGPVVTSTMLARGHDVRKTIGTVNTAEFVVTVAQTTAFFTLLNDFTSHWQVILALIIGGMTAAPFAAWICRRCPVRPLLGIVGSAIILLNLYNFIARFA